MQYRAAVITISSKCALGERSDVVGNHLVGMLTVAGYQVIKRISIPDDEETIVKELLKSCEEEKIQLIITSGGTGLTPTDVTPEATRRVIEKEIPGFNEAVRLHCLQSTERSILSRGVSGWRKGCLIINLPSKLITVEEGLDVILPSIRAALDTITKDYTKCEEEK